MRTPARRAFSLLELLLAMAVVSMLALSLYTAMDVSLRAHRSAAAAVETTRAVAIAADLVRRDLESVPPPTGTLAGPFIGVHQPGAGGDTDSMQFCTIGSDEPVEDVPMSEGIRRVELLVRTDMTPPSPVRRVTRNLLASSDPQVNEEVLCRDVRSFSLRYFDGATWQENWDSTTLGDVLPAAVGITLELNDPPGVRAGAAPRRISRVIPLSCAKPAEGTL